MRIFIFLLLLIPFVYASYEVFYIQEVNDPIKYIYSISGGTAIVIAFFTTTISLIKKKINLMKYRRMIGLFAFFYASLHMINFIVLDMELDILFAIEETLDKPFIYLGMISFLILLFMAFTSSKKLFKKYNKYHRGLYLVLLLTTIHFVMAQKSLSILQWSYLGTIFVIVYYKGRQRVI